MTLEEPRVSFFAEEEDEDDADRDVDERASFFSEAEDSDLAVCAGVFKTYMRESVERGIATAEEQKREVHRALIESNAERVRRATERRRAEVAAKNTARKVEREAIATMDVTEHHEEEMPMSKQQHGSVAEIVKSHHAAFVAKHGRNPNPKELFAACDGASASVESVRMIARKSGLELTRMNAAGSEPPKAETKSTQLAKRAASDDVVRRAPSPRATKNAPSSSAGSALDALLELRKELAMKIEKLDGAIEVLAS